MENHYFEFLKEAYERQGRLIDTRALLEGYISTVNAELGDMANRSARPQEFELLIAGETWQPGSVTCADIQRAIMLGKVSDEKSPPEENLPRDGRFIPLSEQVRTCGTERLIRDLGRRRAAYQREMSVEFAAAVLGDGYDMAHVDHMRAQSREAIRVMEAELKTRKPIVENVRSIVRAATEARTTYAETARPVSALPATVEVDVDRIESVHELLTSEQVKMVENLRWEMRREWFEEESREAERLLYVEIDDYFASLTPEQLVEWDRLIANVNPKGIKAPFVELLGALPNEILKEKLVSAERWHAYLLTDDYTQTAIVDGGGAAEKLTLARNQAFAKIQQIRRELHTRQLTDNNVTRLGNQPKRPTAG